MCISKMKLLFILICVQNICAYNILGLFPYPGKSHFDVFKPILEHLHEKGNNLTVISYYPRANATENYRDISLTDFIRPYVDAVPFSDLTNSRLRKYLGAKTIFNMGIEYCSVLSSEKMRNFLQEQNDFDLILAEAFVTDCFYGFSYHFNRPLISISTCKPFSWLNANMGNPENPSLDPNVFLDHDDEMDSFLTRFENFLLNLFQKSLYNFYFIPKQNAIARQYFGNHLPDLREIFLNYSKVMFLNTHFLTNLPSAKTPNIIEIGGVHLYQPKKLPKEIEEFIENSKHGAIYVSMGSLIKGDTLAEDKRLLLLNVFKQFPLNFIWKWEKEEMHNKSNNVMIKKWFPQFDILSHPNVKGFISHGGLLSSIELLHCGVPAVIFPQFGDQFANAAALQKRNIAISLSFHDINASKLFDAINNILSNKYQKRAKYLSEIFKNRPQSVLNLTTFWIEFIAKHKDFNETKSASIKLSFYQYYNIDILFVVFATIFLFILFIFGLFLVLRSKFSEKIKVD